MAANPNAGLVYSTVVDSQHHGALIKIAAGIGLTASIELLIVRLLVRWPWRSLVGLDDGVIILGTVLAIVQAACSMSAVNHGLGTAPALLSSSRSISDVEKLVAAGNFLYIFSLYASKLSMALFYRRLSDFHSKLPQILAVLSGVFCLASVLILAIQISPPSWLTLATVSESVVNRWIVVESLSSFLEILVAIFPIYLVKELQMSRQTKIIVVILFWLRLPLIVLSALRLRSLSRELHDSNEPTFRLVGSEIYLQAVMAYSLCSATLPCLRLFLTTTESGIMSLIPEIEIEDTQMAEAGSSSFSASASGSRANRRIPRSGESIELTNRTVESSAAEAIGGGKSKASLASDSSARAIIVRQTVDVSSHSAS